MPFTTPSTVTASTPATAVWANEQVRDNVKWLATDSPHARVNASAVTSIPNNVWTPVNFAAERYDVGTIHSTAATVQGDGFPLNTRLVVPAGGGGVYYIGASVALASSSGGVSIKVNGTTFIVQGGVNTVAGLVNTDYILAAGDYVQVGIQQASGGAINTVNTANVFGEFWMHWVNTG